MEVIRYLNALAVTQVIAFISIGIFLDAIFPLKVREYISTYLLGSSNIEHKEFESATITTIIEFFLDKETGEVSAIRVVLCTTPIFLVTYFLWGFWHSYETIEYCNANPAINWGPHCYEDSDPLSGFRIFGIIFLIPLLFASLPFDLFSIYVTKKIFYYQYMKTRYFPLAIISDVFISCLPLFIALYILEALYGFSPRFIKDFAVILIAPIYIGVLFSFVTSVTISVLQVLISIGGFLIKILRVGDLMYGGLYESLRVRPFSLIFFSLTPLILVVEFALQEIVLQSSFINWILDGYPGPYD